MFPMSGVVADRSSNLARNFSEARKVLELESSIGLYELPKGRVESSSAFLLCFDPQSDTFGGKASGILELRREGLKTPNSLLISRDVVSYYLGNEKREQTGASEEGKLSFARIVEAASIASGISGWRAIRSSGSEDLETHPAAGVFATTFCAHNSTRSLLAECLECVAESAFSPAAELFYSKHGLSSESIGMVIQNVEATKFERQGFSSNCVSPFLSMVADSSHPGRIMFKAVLGLASSAVKANRSASFLVEVEGDRVNQVVSLRDITAQTDQDYLSPASIVPVSYPLRLREVELPGDIIDVTRRLASAIASMPKRERFGWDIELTFPTIDDFLAVRPTYLQRRPVRGLNPDFKLPEFSSEELLAESGSVIGQSCVGANTAVFVNISAGKMHPDAASFLSAFDSKDTEYILVLNARAGTLYPENLTYGATKNLRGIIVIDWTKSGHFGQDAVDHFSQSLKAEGKPVVILNIDRDLQRLKNQIWFRTGLAEMNNRAPAVSQIQGDLVVGVDGYSNKGIIAVTGGRRPLVTPAPASPESVLSLAPRSMA